MAEKIINKKIIDNLDKAISYNDTVLLKQRGGNKQNAAEYIEKNYPKMSKEFRRLQEEQYELFLRKQYDYGKSNITLGGNVDDDDDNRVAITALVIRLNDKIQRLLNIVIKRKMSETQNETIEDTFVDIANYANIALVVKSKKWGK